MISRNSKYVVAGIEFRTRVLNLLFCGARPLGMSWKEFYEDRNARRSYPPSKVL